MIIDCYQSILLHNKKDFEIVFLTDENIKDFLPDLDERVWLFKQIAHRADYIRFKILYKYGGIWLDSDTMVFKSLAPIIEKIDRHGFVCTGYYDKKGNLFPLIAFIACTKNHNIRKMMLDNIELFFPKLEAGMNPEWDEIGGNKLTNILKNNKAYIEDINLFSPIPIWTWPEEVFLGGCTYHLYKSLKKAYCQMLTYSNMADVYDFFGNDYARSRTNLGIIYYQALGIKIDSLIILKVKNILRRHPALYEMARDLYKKIKSS